MLRFDCSIPEQRAAGIEAAVDAVRQGKLVVIPTDTVYGIGADAFTPSAVNALLAAKGRGRDMPVPVLVGSVRAANALLDDLGPYGQDLIDAFWPGPLTIIGHAVRSLQWDLGETKGTVAVRMPLHAVALDLLKETGPMAVSSANRSGAPPATTVAEAEEQLGDSVAVYLDGGRCTQPFPPPSSTSPRPCRGCCARAPSRWRSSSPSSGTSPRTTERRYGRAPARRASAAMPSGYPGM